MEDDDTVDPANYRSIILDVHTGIVAGHLANRRQSRMLQLPAHAISPSEIALPRHFRTTLSQVRAVQCSQLNSYLHAIGASDTDLCPE